MSDKILKAKIMMSSLIDIRMQMRKDNQSDSKAYDMIGDLYEIVIQHKMDF